MTEVVARALGEGSGRPPVAPIAAPPPGALRVCIEKAAGLVHMGSQVGAGVRLRRAKLLALRAARLITKEQTAYNTAVVDALRQVEETLVALRAEWDQRLAAAQGATAGTEVTVSELAESLRSLERRVDGLRRAVAPDAPPEGVEPGTPGTRPA